MFMEAKGHLQELLNADVIHKSHNPWASNIVLMREKDMFLMLCVDYRQLNKKREQLRMPMLFPEFMTFWINLLAISILLLLIRRADIIKLS